MSSPALRVIPPSEPMALLRPPTPLETSPEAMDGEAALPVLRAWCRREGHDLVAAHLRRAFPGRDPVLPRVGAPLWVVRVDPRGRRRVDASPCLLDAVDAALVGLPEGALSTALGTAREGLFQEQYP